MDKICPDKQQKLQKDAGNLLFVFLLGQNLCLSGQIYWDKQNTEQIFIGTNEQMNKCC